MVDLLRVHKSQKGLFPVEHLRLQVVAKFERHPHDTHSLQLRIGVRQSERQIHYVSCGGDLPLGVGQDTHASHGVKLRSEEPLSSHHTHVVSPAAEVMVFQGHAVHEGRDVRFDVGDDVANLRDDVLVVDRGVVPGPEDEAAHDLVFVKLQGVVMVGRAVWKQVLDGDLVLQQYRCEAQSICHYAF